MSRLLLKISGHPWCRVPQRISAINGHIWACSFSASLWFLGCCRLHLVTCQQLVSVSIDAVAFVSCFGHGRVWARWDRTSSEGIGRMRLAVGFSTWPGCKCQCRMIRKFLPKFVETPTPRDLVDMVEHFNLNSFFHSFSLPHDHDRHKLNHNHGYQ